MSSHVLGIMSKALLRNMNIAVCRLTMATADHTEDVTRILTGTAAMEKNGNTEAETSLMLKSLVSKTETEREKKSTGQETKCE